MAFKTRWCLTCNAPFDPTGARTKYCPEHSRHFRRQVMNSVVAVKRNFTCRHCLAEFRGEWGHRFCSAKCKADHKAIKTKETRAWDSGYRPSERAAVTQSRDNIRAYIKSLM
jgi:hypothetical protein